MSLLTDPVDVGPVSSTEQRRLVVNANYELFVLALTIVQIVNAFLWLFLKIPQEKQVILVIAPGIGLFLVIDACYRLYKAPIRRQFLISFRGWLVFVGSLPVPFLAVLRLYWYWWITRTMRRPDFARVGELVIEKRAQSTLLAVVFAVVVVLEAAAILILRAETPDPQANIQTASDSIWWTIVTVATVGYGDKYPVTNAGRAVGVLVMIVGVGLFSVFTSFMAQWFLRSRSQTSTGSQPTTEVIDYAALVARLDAITKRLDEPEATGRMDARELYDRLATIEQKLDQGS